MPNTPSPRPPDPSPSPDPSPAPQPPPGSPNPGPMARQALESGRITATVEREEHGRRTSLIRRGIAVGAAPV
jgi:hypothetical protein